MTKKRKRIQEVESETKGQTCEVNVKLIVELAQSSYEILVKTKIHPKMVNPVEANREVVRFKPGTSPLANC